MALTWAVSWGAVFGLAAGMMAQSGSDPHGALPAPARVRLVHRAVVHGVELHERVCPAFHGEISEVPALRTSLVAKRLGLGRAGIELRKCFFPLLVDKIVVLLAHHGPDPGRIVHAPLPAVFEAQDSDGDRHEVVPLVGVDR